MHYLTNLSYFLRVRRLRVIALEASKILNNQTSVYVSDLLTFKSHSYSFRYTNIVEAPQVRTSKYGVRSFRSTAAKMWNSLPQQFREIITVEQFRSQISTWSRGVCTCLVCSVKFYVDPVHFAVVLMFKS